MYSNFYVVYITVVVQRRASELCVADAGCLAISFGPYASSLCRVGTTVEGIRCPNSVLGKLTHLADGFLSE